MAGVVWDMIAGVGGWRMPGKWPSRRAGRLLYDGGSTEKCLMCDSLDSWLVKADPVHDGALGWKGKRARHMQVDAFGNEFREGNLGLVFRKLPLRRDAFLETVVKNAPVCV